MELTHSMTRRRSFNCGRHSQPRTQADCAISSASSVVAPRRRRTETVRRNPLSYTCPNSSRVMRSCLLIEARHRIPGHHPSKRPEDGARRRRAFGESWDRSSWVVRLRQRMEGAFSIAAHSLFARNEANSNVALGADSIGQSRPQNAAKPRMFTWRQSGENLQVGGLSGT